MVSNTTKYYMGKSIKISRDDIDSAISPLETKLDKISSEYNTEAMSVIRLAGDVITYMKDNDRYTEKDWKPIEDSIDKLFETIREKPAVALLKTCEDKLK